MESRDVIEYVQNDAGEWFWRHLDRNGEQLARSSETYTRKDDMLRASERTLGPERLRGMEVKTYPKAARDAAAARGEGMEVGENGEHAVAAFEHALGKPDPANAPPPPDPDDPLPPDGAPGGAPPGE